MKTLTLLAVCAVSGCAVTSGGRSTMDSPARHSPEPQALWARPQEVGYVIGNEIVGEATTVRVLGIFTFGAEDGSNPFIEFARLLGLSADEKDPLVRAAAANAVASAQNTDGIYVTTHETSNLNLFLFSKRTATVRGRAIQLKPIGEVSLERADRERMLRAISGSQVHVSPEMVNQAR